MTPDGQNAHPLDKAAIREPFLPCLPIADSGATAANTRPVHVGDLRARRSERPFPARSDGFCGLRQKACWARSRHLIVSLREIEPLSEIPLQWASFVRWRTLDTEGAEDGKQNYRDDRANHPTSGHVAVAEINEYNAERNRSEGFLSGNSMLRGEKSKKKSKK